MNDFKTRLTHFSTLVPIYGKTIVEFKTNEGVSDEEIATVESELGFSLDPNFLSYFKSTNGWTLKWVEGGELSKSDAETKLASLKSRGHRGQFGEIVIPSLESLFSKDLQHYLGDGDASYKLPILGGYSDLTLRENLRMLNNPGEDYFNFVTIFADDAHKDPVCLRADDHGADLSGAHPIRARTYFELQMFYLGDGQDDFFSPKGFGGDHSLIDINASEFPSIPRLLPEPNEARITYIHNMGSYLRHLAGLGTADPYQITTKPVKRNWRFFDAKPRTKLTKAIALVDSLELFDSQDEDTIFTFFANKSGELFDDCDAALQVWPPYGKKSPQAQLFWGDAFPESAVDCISEALTEFGMILRPGSD